MGSNWTVGKKLFSAIGVLVAIVFIGGAQSWWSERGASSRFDDAVDQAHQLRLAAKLKRLGFELYAAEKILILSGYDNDKKNYDTWVERNKVVLADFNKTVEAITPIVRIQVEKDALAKSQGLIQQWEINNVDVRALIDAGKYHDAQMLSRAKNRALTDENAALIDAILDSQEKRLVEAKAEGQAAAQKGLTVIGLMVLVSLAIAGLVVWLVRGITRQLRDTAVEMRTSAEQVVAASSQVASSAQSLSQGSTEQAASLEETSASMEEMASMTRKNAQNSQQAAGLVVETEKAVQESNVALAAMVEAMAGIRDSSGKISKIIKTIDEIAFQTNILALNAAVEAARAGEAGMGFAVVADEVRNLAQRSAQAAKDTASLIEDAIARSQQGSDRVTQMGSVIGVITEKATKVRSLVDEISVASREQTQGIEQVTQSISQMEQVTQTTAATAEESAAASEELNAQAETSMQVVGNLEMMVGGSRSASIPARTVARKAAPAAGGKVVKMSMTPRAKTGPTPTKAEKAIPFDDTGTFGKF
ncbi:MAG: methyl-accepting chemotaxis protein [Acidobacteria bacterium]|nr:methyl-accepting chemotaxis protein [Acidobacteriota bacterium]